ncbi:MAG: zinc ribbon domain-containing protein [Gracilimonas sp.]|nr:zinc ribbon domain-containing protein [Gracilimonas sp.]
MLLNQSLNISSDTPAVLTDICTCGFCDTGMTVSSTTNRHNKKYYYYKCALKNNEGKTEDHNPKDLPVHTLDEFVYNTLVVLLEEPELLKAMKKRIKYEGEDRISEIEKRIKQIQNLLKVRKKDKANALKLVTDNAASSLKETYESQLESIVLEIEEKENEIEFLSEQLKV